MTNPIIAVYTRQGYPSANVLKYMPDYVSTSINTLIIAGPNGSDGKVVYNDSTDPMFDKSGKYVGDKDWATSLTTLVAGTGILSTHIFLSLSDSAISALAAMADNLPGVMSWLKSNGIAGIDMDCESLAPTDFAVQIVTLAAIEAGLALTAAPYINLTGWQSWISFVTQNNGTVSWLNIQCYSGGAGNDPVADWAVPLSPVKIVAGFEASPGADEGALTPSGAQTQLAAWQAESPTSTPNCLAGAFIWDFGIVMSGSYTVAEYATAMQNGLT